jgi:hypothetical protein
VVPFEIQYYVPDPAPPGYIPAPTGTTFQLYTTFVSYKVNAGPLIQLYPGAGGAQFLTASLNTPVPNTFQSFSYPNLFSPMPPLQNPCTINPGATIEAHLNIKTKVNGAQNLSPTMTPVITFTCPL